MIPKKLFSGYCRETAHMNSVIVTVVKSEDLHKLKLDRITAQRWKMRTKSHP